MKKATNRWGIAFAGFFMQVALGAVYGWSVFRNPLMERFGWTVAQVTLTFTICIGMLGVASLTGGLWMNRVGPRVVAIAGGAFYGAGVFLSSFSAIGLWWLYLSYGVLGGIGLGFAYIVPIAVLIKWFPDRRGLMTGIAVCGFGAGALVSAPLAEHLIRSPDIGVLKTFAILGMVYLVVTLLAGGCMRDPPENWKPEGWDPAPAQMEQSARKNFTFREALRSWQWWALWFMLFLNSCAGISLISQEAPVFERLTGASAAAAAGMVGIASVGNALGRVVWAAFSDVLTRRRTFAAIFLLQAGLYLLLPAMHSAAAVTAVAFLILMNYGGGFGTMPAFAADFFGAKQVGAIYGFMATAWSCGAFVGPQILVRLLGPDESYAAGFHVLAVLLFAFTALPIAVSPPKAKTEVEAAHVK